MAVALREPERTNETYAIPAPPSAKMMLMSSIVPRLHLVKISPKATGIIDWNIMAPVMLLTARVSWPRKIHVTELYFSGSSVAKGAKIRERTSAGNYMKSAKAITADKKNFAPAKMNANPATSCTATVFTSMGIPA